MSDFIEVTVVDPICEVKYEKFINISHIESIKNEGKKGCTIYTDLACYNCQETYDEVIKKIKETQFNNNIDKASAIIYEHSKSQKTDAQEIIEMINKGELPPLTSLKNSEDEIFGLQKLK